MSMITLSMSAQTIGQYTASQVAELKNDLQAGKYDVYELTEAADYILTSQIIPAKTSIIRAAEGLPSKPVIKFSNTSNLNMFRVNDPDVTLTFEGIEFDGRNVLTDGGIVKLYASDTEAINSKLIINDCYIHHFTGDYVIRNLRPNFSLEIDKSVISDISGASTHFIQPFYPQATNSNYTLTNSTFANFSGGSKIIGTGTAGLTVTFLADHCTFHNSTSTSNLLSPREEWEDITISNSVFTSITKRYSHANTTIENSYINGFETVPTNATIVNSFEAEPAPAYADASLLHLGLTNKEDFITPDGLPAGNTMYYLEDPTAAVSNISDTGFDLSWEPIDNADSYDVYLYQGETLVSQSTVTEGTTHSFTGLTAKTTYTTHVVAKSADTFYVESQSPSVEVNTLTTGLSSAELGKEFNLIDKTIYLREKGKLEVYNLQGAKLISVNNVSSYNTNLGKGVYVIVISNKSGITSAKISIR